MPSSFFSRDLYDQVGGIDERFKYAMDSDLWLRFAHKAQISYLPFVDYAWGLRLHPEAKTSGHLFLQDGSMAANSSGSERERLGAKYDQMLKEAAYMHEYFTPKRSSIVRRVLSVSWRQVFGAIMDTIRFRGKHYMEYYK